MAILELLAFDAFAALAHHLRLWKDNLRVLYRAQARLPVVSRFHFPQFYHAVICREQLQTAVFIVMQKFQRVDLLVEFDTLQVVKLGLMTLNLRKVAVVKVATIFELHVAEDDHAASSIPHRQVLTSLVKSDGSQNVRVCYVGCLTLAQPINIHPVDIVIAPVSVLVPAIV